MSEMLSDNKKTMGRFITLPAVFSFTVLLGVFCLLFQDNAKMFRSSESILFLPKSETAIAVQDAIVNNSLEFPKKVDFYESLLKFNPNMRDIAAGKNADERVATWNSIFSIKRDAASATIVTLSITTKNKADSVFILEKTAKQFVSTVGQYYDIKKDLELRIISGPTTVPVKTGFWFIFMKSLLLALLITFAVQYAIIVIEDMLLRRSEEDGLFGKKIGALLDFGKSKIGSLEELYKKENEPLVNIQPESEKQEAVPVEENAEVAEEAEGDFEKTQEIPEQEKPKEIAEIEKRFQQMQYPNFPEMPVIKSPTASAPDNLPIGDDDSLMNLSFGSSEEKASNIENKSPNVIEEKIKKDPSKEEIKKRLNQLLRGKM